MQKNFPIIDLFKRPIPAISFAVVTSIVLYVNYYAMANFPGTNGFQCIIGANFTPTNIIFSLLISIAAGLLVGGLIELHYKKKDGRSIGIGSASASGLAVGMLTTFCTLCTIPVISLFGVGISLGFITEYELYFKLLSFVLMVIAIYLLNKQLKGECKRCVK